jgi:hypothetical protein
MIEAIEGDFEAKKTEFLKVVIDNKADAEQEIERRRKLGITDISDINPHPDDLLVDMATGEVHVKDELNPKDSRMLKGIRGKMRGVVKMFDAELAKRRGEK